MKTFRKAETDEPTCRSCGLHSYDQYRKHKDFCFKMFPGFPVDLDWTCDHHMKNKPRAVSA